MSKNKIRKLKGKRYISKVSKNKKNKKNLKFVVCQWKDSPLSLTEEKPKMRFQRPRLFFFFFMTVFVQNYKFPKNQTETHKNPLGIWENKDKVTYQERWRSHVAHHLVLFYRCFAFLPHALSLSLFSYFWTWSAY